MKTALTLLASGFLAASAMAQPSFTTLPVPTNGSKVSRTIDYTGGTNPSGLAGANKTWDYSTLDYSSAPDDESTDYTDASGADHVSDFPGATWYSVGVTDDDGPFESYYQMTSNSYNAIGYYGYDQTVFYSDPQTIYSVPFLYGETQNDTYASSYESLGFDFTDNGSTSTLFDGYGTLVMPYGTVTDVARWKTTYHSTTVITEQANSSNVTTYVSDVIEYVWILPGATDPLLFIAYIDETRNGDPLPSKVTAQVFIPQTATGIIKNTTALNALIYPQPAKDQLTVMAEKLQGDCQVKIYNLSGNIISERKQFADAEKLTVDVQDLPTGMYMLEVINGDRTYRKKIVVQ